MFAFFFKVNVPNSIQRVLIRSGSRVTYVILNRASCTPPETFTTHYGFPFLMYYSMWCLFWCLFKCACVHVLFACRHVGACFEWIFESLTSSSNRKCVWLYLFMSTAPAQLAGEQPHTSQSSWGAGHAGVCHHQRQNQASSGPPHQDSSWPPGVYVHNSSSVHSKAPTYKKKTKSSIDSLVRCLILLLNLYSSNVAVKEQF